MARALHASSCQFFLYRGGIVSRRIVVVLLATLSLAGIVGSREMLGQAPTQSEDVMRRAKSKVEPVYPELARKMNISGTVKIQVTVLPNGTVKDARVVGGHPVLASAALDAAKKWRFEPGPNESTGIIDFKFEPRD